ncbi:MAG: hypothetical protein ACYTCU_09305, partial [Planctomycetota bacterium]
MKSLPQSFRLVGLALLVCTLMIAGAPAAPAQCFGPDNLDSGPCCTSVFPNLPQFPAMQVPGMGICWNNCSVAGTQNLRVDWTLPRLVACGQYDTALTVSDAGSGVSLMFGKLQLDYTRTWDESDTAGIQTQVWRFAAKADLSLVPGVPPPCTVPTCLPPPGSQPTAYYYGYVDYTSCSAAGPWEAVLVLYHACDRFIHSPGLSDRPGVFHPNSAFGIVAPHSALQPFVPADIFAPGGPLVGEGARTLDTSTPPPQLCLAEDPVVSGAMTPLGAGCVCTLSTFPNHQTLRKFSGTNACIGATGVPGGWASLDIAFPTLPWKHMVSTSIGRWSNPNVYPGQEACWVDEGLFVHLDPCKGDFIELKYGGSTADGWTPLLPVPVPVNSFTDIADNWSAPLGGPYPTPILGSIQTTERL